MCLFLFSCNIHLLPVCTNSVFQVIILERLSQTCLECCSRSFTGPLVATDPTQILPLRAEQRLTDAPWTCFDVAPAHLHQSHTCVPSQSCHVVVSLHPDMILARLVVLLASFNVCYVQGESLTLCNSGILRAVLKRFSFVLPWLDIRRSTLSGWKEFSWNAFVQGWYLCLLVKSWF